MKITQSFTVARPASAVWAFFQDVPAVADCLPGAELLETTKDGAQRGKVSVTLGPFKAAFEGEAKITADRARLHGHVEGRGVDKRGGSHSKMSLNYQLSERHGTTLVDLDVDLVLSGPIAQFGRTGIVTEATKVLIGEFAHNLEARLSPAYPKQPLREPNPRSALSMLFTAVRSWFAHLLGKPG
jgi:uncharacterized protein